MTQQVQQEQEQGGQEQDIKVYDTIGTLAEEENAISTIESLCMNCRQNGETRVLLTEIPLFRQIILMSFRCPHCGYSNNEIQSGAEVQSHGGTYNLVITKKDDLQRQVVKSDTATLRVEELDFEIPPGKGVLTTIEGLLQSALDNLKDSQDQRRKVDEQVASQVEEFIAKLAMALCGVSLPLHLSLDDPSGNSYIENPFAPQHDPNMTYTTYLRTEQQQKDLGLQIENIDTQDKNVMKQKEKEALNREEAASTFVTPEGSTIDREKRDDSTMMEKEVYQIPSDCPNCGTAGMTKSCLTDIPFFKEILIMAFDCPSESCGYKSNEVKAGGAIPEKGQKSILLVGKKEQDEEAWAEDMRRDVVKSNSAGINIPELEIEIVAGSLGGLYTTVEGLLALIKSSLFEGVAADFVRGDSAPDAQKDKFNELEQKFNEMCRGEMSFTLEIVDPLASSYIYSPTAPEPEPRLKCVEYERSFDENEDLGLNDMCTENYEVLDKDNKNIKLAGSTQSTADDSTLAFEGPYDTFQGVRAGMVFRLGTLGLGYYEDKERSASSTAQQTMAQLQEHGSKTHPNPDAVQK